MRLEVKRDYLACETFQFTHPRGVRLGGMVTKEGSFKFQFTHPRGVRLQGGGAVEPHLHVSIHAPARGATVPPPHGGLKGAVSIHAPAKGATGDLDCHSVSPIVSIHAPAKGATHSLHSPRQTGRSFNSRTPEGCDCRDGEVAVELPLQTCFSEGTQIIPSLRCREHINPYNRMSMSACECLANC